MDNLANQQDPPELYAPELRSYIRTPSLEILSSSVENSPPTTIKALERNQAKIIRDIREDLVKAQRNIAKNFKHQLDKFEELAMTQDSLRRVRAAQDPQRRVYTKRQVKPLSQDGILKPRDANRSIKERKEKENAIEKRRIDKAAEKAYGFKPSQLSDVAIQKAIDNEKEAREKGELFFIG